jgi:hypothetical protein
MAVVGRAFALAAVIPRGAVIPPAQCLDLGCEQLGVPQKAARERDRLAVDAGAVSS